MSSVVIDRDVPVEMRDGVELATDVYRPPGDGENPTLVHRVPYDKSNATLVGGLMFNPITAVERGYAVVVQDTRGRFESAGEWDPMRVEMDDGYDTVEWAADQVWSDGTVGVYGSSYMGVTAWHAAVANPPSLEAAVPYLTGGNYHEGWTYTGGAFELGFNLHWILGLGWDRLERTADVEAARRALTAAFRDPMGTAERLPIRDIVDGLEEFAPYWRDWLDHPAYDEYWESIDVAARADSIEVPVLHVTGWFDLFLRGHLDVHKAIEERGTDRARENQRFVVGPWDHKAYLTSMPAIVGDRQFGPDLAGGVAFMQERTLAWFDRWLKGEDPDIATDGVQYFDLGRREWQESDAWPPDHEARPLYLNSGGSANSRLGDGVLAESAPGAGVDSFIYDPMEPVPTHGGRDYMPEMDPGGIQDRSEIEERDDVLVYTSPRLATPLSIAGPVDVTLHASSSAPDTDFTATLVDVAPDGYCAGIADGIIRARYRTSMEEAQFLEPGEVHELAIDLWSVAHTFDTGHRVRLEISSSNFPRFDRNPNSAVPVAEATRDQFQTATQRIHHGEEHPSRLRLPVVE